VPHLYTGNTIDGLQQSTEWAFEPVENMQKPKALFLRKGRQDMRPTGFLRLEHGATSNAVK
jgi:hypothetical protein